MRKTMKVSLSYKGNDPCDTRDYNTYLDIAKIEFSECGNLYLTHKNGEVEGVSSTFTDYMDITVNDTINEI